MFIGRPVFATDATGAKVWEAVYLPFGGMLASSGSFLPPVGGPPPAPGTPTSFPLRFPGQWFQAESGLYQNWMRDYDPTTGRYMQADPLGLVDGASVYGYARQNPGRYFDFFGLESGVANPGDFDIGIGDIIGGGIKIGGRLVGGVIAGIFYPSSTAVDDTIEEGSVCEPNKPDCGDHFSQCVNTYLGYKNSGSVYGETACTACFNQCRVDNGVWPNRVLGVDRCDYWNLPGGGWIP